jgi:hypothetical protein
MPYGSLIQNIKRELASMSVAELDLFAAHIFLALTQAIADEKGRRAAEVLSGNMDPDVVPEITGVEAACLDTNGVLRKVLTETDSAGFVARSIKRQHQCKPPGTYIQNTGQKRTLQLCT